MKDSSVVRFEDAPNVSFELHNQNRDIIVSAGTQKNCRLGPDLSQDLVFSRLQEKLCIN